MKKVLDGLNPELEELLSYIPATDSDVVTKLSESIRYSGDAISAEYDNLARKDDLDFFMSEDVEELLSYIPATDSDVVRRLLDSINGGYDEKMAILSKYTGLVEKDNLEDGFMEIQELLSYVPISDAEVASKLLDCLNCSLDEKRKILARYHDLIQQEQPLARTRR